eukprot:6494659-Prymnesium_polylepis.3
MECTTRALITSCAGGGHNDVLRTDLRINLVRGILTQPELISKTSCPSSPRLTIVSPWNHICGTHVRNQACVLANMEHGQ